MLPEHNHPSVLVEGMVQAAICLGCQL